uniref:Uncharacterized protein n=1 Tax=Ciona intestinalis TaxID=7719 RepID=H2XU75_CIOIN
MNRHDRTTKTKHTAQIMLINSCYLPSVIRTIILEVHELLKRVDLGKSTLIALRTA